MGTAKTVLTTIAVLAVAAGLLALAIVYGGLYNVASTAQHTQPVYSVLEIAMRQSVRLRARGIEAPGLEDEQRVRRGAGCFQAKCVQCHGAPGVAQNDIGKSMQPVPGPLVDARQRWQPRELYWLTRHGIKMSGMPAWEFHMSDEDIWAVVAFLGRLPELTPRQYEEAVAFSMSPASMGPMAAQACSAASAAEAPSNVGVVDIRRGQRALYQYACHACHTIPGITGSRSNVGPPLTGIANRQLIGGKLANNQENMIRWLRHTREVDPLTAMPQMNVSERDARDMAAFLATLD